MVVPCLGLLNPVVSLVYHSPESGEGRRTTADGSLLEFVGVWNENIQNCWQGSGGLIPASVSWWCSSILSSYIICFPTLGKWKCEDGKAFGGGGGRGGGGSSRSVLILKQVPEEKTPATVEPGSRRIQASTTCLGPSPLPGSWLCRLVRGSVAER